MSSLSSEGARSEAEGGASTCAGMCGIPGNSVWSVETGWAPGLINVSLAMCPGLVTLALGAWFLPLENGVGDYAV